MKRPNRPKLSPAAEALLKERMENGLPVWVRSPGKEGGVEYFSSLCGSTLYKLAELGKIKAASVRFPGTTRGTRLYNLRSILDLIEKCVDTTTGEDSTSNGAPAQPGGEPE